MVEVIVRKAKRAFPQTKTSLLESMLYCLEILYLRSPLHCWVRGLGFPFCLGKSNAAKSKHISVCVRPREAYSHSSPGMQHSWVVSRAQTRLPWVKAAKCFLRAQHEFPGSGVLLLFLIPPADSQMTLGKLDSSPGVHFIFSCLLSRLIEV